MNAELLITLQQIIITAQREKEKLLRGGKGLPENIMPDEPNFADYIPAQPAIEQKSNPTLMERILANKQKQQIADDNQINVDEAIESVKQNNDADADMHYEKKPHISFSQRVREYFDAHNAWRVEKWRKEYEYACNKTEVIDKCYGFDVMIDYVNKIIKEYQKIGEPSADYQTINEDNQLI